MFKKKGKVLSLLLALVMLTTVLGADSNPLYKIFL